MEIIRLRCGIVILSVYRVDVSRLHAPLASSKGKGMVHICSYFFLVRLLDVCKCVLGIVYCNCFVQNL